MPLYTVRVANQETGTESTIELTANSAAAAERYAQADGWLVASVSEVASAMPSASGLAELVEEVRGLRADLAAVNAPPRTRTSFGVIVGVVILVLCVLGVAVEVGLYRYTDPPKGQEITEATLQRFSVSNAMGASANALETIERTLGGMWAMMLVSSFCLVMIAGRRRSR